MIDFTFVNPEQFLSFIVGSLGFPIVCCYFMWKYINTTLKDFTEMMNKNNETISELCSKIDVIIMKIIGGDEDANS